MKLSIRAALPLVLFLVSASVLLLTAWVSDDAFITLRTVDNWRHGYGLTWNISERVQTYTHPLWMLLLAAIHVLIPNGYFTALTAGLLISLSVIAVFIREYRGDPFLLTFGWAILTISKSFTDYSSSGLENPLTHLIVLLFTLGYLKTGPRISDKRLFYLALLAGLGTLNRMDTILLFAPVLAYLWVVQYRTWRGLGILFLGFLPFLVWELFAMYYYGFPFPNTAYAKLNAGIPTLALIRQGALYYQNSLLLDPVTLLTMGYALGLTVVKRSPGKTWLATGMGLYLAYVLFIGGDFMSGRFFSPVVLTAVILSLHYLRDSGPSRNAIVSGYLASAAILLVGSMVWHPSPASNQSDLASNAIDSSSKISDERLFYFSTNGLVNIDFDEPIPKQVWAEIGRTYRTQGRQVRIETAVGMIGYFAGPEVHIVDIWAICDPLLARLDTLETDWRIGHYTRPVIDGYIETLQTGENRIKDPAIARYYSNLKIIVSGELWSWKRFETIWKMNTGQYDYLLDRTE